MNFAGLLIRGNIHIQNQIILVLLSFLLRSSTLLLDVDFMVFMAKSKFELTRSFDELSTKLVEKEMKITRMR